MENRKNESDKKDGKAENLSYHTVYNESYCPCLQFCIRNNKEWYN